MSAIEYPELPADFTDADTDTTGAAAEVKKKWEAARKAQRRAILQYQVNSSYLVGDQWLEPEFLTNQVREVDRDPSRVQVTDNRILASTRINMAKLHRRPLAFEVQPSDTDDATAQAAQLAEMLLEDTAREHNWEDIRLRADMVAWLCGVGVISLDWDPTRGNALGINELTGQPYGTGDVIETVSSIAEVAFEPGTLDPEHAAWWIRAVAMSPERAQEMYGLSSKPKGDALSAEYGGIGDPVRKDAFTQSQLTLVLTYYERPSQGSDGKVSVVIGDKVVAEGPWPFPFEDRLNCVVFAETSVPGRWFGETVVSAAVPMQLAYNAAISSLIEHQKNCGNARMLVPNSSMEITEEMSDTPGEIIVYMDGMEKPTYISPPILSNFVMEMLPTLRRELDDLLGTQEISRGAAPANAESGLAYQVLVDQADTPLTQFAVQAGRAWGRLASMVLKLYEANVEETRKVAHSTPNMPVVQTEWTGQSLSGQTTAIVPADTVIPRSRAGQEAFGLRMWDAKIISDPKVLADFMEMPLHADLLEAIDPDVARAQRENYKLFLGQPCRVEKFDNHQKHIVEHNKARKTKRYENGSPEERMAFDEHVLAHEAAQLMEAQDQLQSPQLAGLPQGNEPVGSVTNPMSSEMAGTVEGLPGGEEAGFEEQMMDEEGEQEEPMSPQAMGELAPAEIPGGLDGGAEL